MAWLPLILFFLMCGVAYIQLIRGTFSAMIMGVFCVVSAAFALGIHETIAEVLLIKWIKDYAYPAAYVGVFSILVIIFRAITDKYIPREAKLPPFLDRIGGTAYGILTGMLVIGVLGTGIQMLPVGPVILGFERIDEEGKEHGLWFHPDAFTVRLSGYLIDSTLSGDEEWSLRHPNFLKEMHWLRNTQSDGSRLSVPPDSVQVESLFNTTRIFEFDTPKTAVRGQTRDLSAVQGPPEGKQWLVVRSRLKDGAKDSDGWYRMSSTQVRVVGTLDDGKEAQYTLKALGLFNNVHIALSGSDTYGNKSGQLDFVFEVPTQFRPRFMEYKRGGYASLTGGGKQPKELSPEPEKTPVLASPERPQRPQERTVPVRPKLGTHFGNELPMTLTRYGALVATLQRSGTAVKQGHIKAYPDEQGIPDNGDADKSSGETFYPVRQTLETFTVPERLHLLQLDVEALHAQSAAGGVLAYTRNVLQKFKVVDRGGQAYFPAGRIAECTIDGKRVLEIQYFPDYAFTERPLPPFHEIEHKHMKDDYRLIYLYLLPPGTEIVTFDTGNKPEDISYLNLKAPSE